MKIFRLLTVLFISTLCFTGCEKEEITNYAFDDVSAPTNVTADFDIAQDDSGTVTITPTGEGAQVFKVYFGDTENEAPQEASAGETLTHTYGEGEYLVRVVAVGATGLTSEFNQRLVISFKAPENLEVNVDQQPTNPAVVNVSASADFAAMYDVYFGVSDDEEPTQLMPDETITYTYAAPGIYTIRVVARGAGVATTETTVEVVVPEANDPVKLPITFDVPTVNYALGTFNGATFAVVDNPFLSGVNSEASNVGKLTNSGALYEGGAYNLGEPVDFSGANKTISMKFYSEIPVSVLLKFEGGLNEERPLEVSADHGGTGWEILTFDFGSDALASYIDGAADNGVAIVPDGQYGTLVLFVEIGKDTAGTFYLDDIKQNVATADCVAETAENIDPANGPINWTFKTDDAAHEFDQFGDVQTDIVANPVTNGINQSCSVQMITKATGCATWSGLGTAIPTAIDFNTTDKKIFKLKVLAQDQLAAVTLRLEKEPYPDVEPAEERIAQITETGVWQELTFDFSEVSDKTFRSIIIYFERDIACDGDVYYFDDLVQTDGGSTNSGPSAAAPTPTLEASNVISLFSGAYTDVAVDTWRTDWSAADYEEVTIASNAVKYYTNLNFVGIETTSSPVDASEMTHFHTDYWTGNAGVFRIKLVDFGPNGVYDGGDDSEHEIEFTATPNTWVSLDIPLSDFTGLTNKTNIAQYIYSATPAGEANVYVDNVYFHK